MPSLGNLDLMPFKNEPLSYEIPGIDPTAYENDWHQLIILGNGFDIECGLKSKFKNFFAKRRNLLVKLLSAAENDPLKVAQSIFDNSKLTVWDIILLDKKGDNWYNIEAAMENWLVGSIENCTDYLDISNRDVDFLDFDFPDVFKEKPIHSDIIKEYIKIANPDTYNTTFWKEDFFEFHMQELHKLEKEFAKYLNKKVSKEDYRQKCNKLFLNILEDSLPNEDDFSIEHSILDFNYTKPYWETLNINKRVSLYNIHGQLENKNIIFGIDGKEYMQESLIVPFTKTYRLLCSRQKPIKDLFYPYNGRFNSGTDVIKFYGHSLSKSDYSYFQAIFDGVNLYESNTELVFYCRPDKKSNQKYMTDMANKVTNLMNSYGATLDNEDHGKNLMHKLLLEGRLSIRTVPQ